MERMGSNEFFRMCGLEDYELDEVDMKHMFDLIAEYASVDNVGDLEDPDNHGSVEENLHQQNFQIGDPENYPFTGDDLLEEEEKPGDTGRKGESRLSIDYEFFQYLACTVGETKFEISEHQKIDLPEEIEAEALGALFGASYAVFRNYVIDNGLSAENESIEQSIESEKEREMFLIEGAVEIKSEIKNLTDSNYGILSDMMDIDEAFDAYKKGFDILNQKSPQ